MAAPLRFELDRRVLEALAALGAAERVTADELAERLGSHSVGVLEALARLEKKRLARRIRTYTGRRLWGQRGAPGLWEPWRLGAA